MVLFDPKEKSKYCFTATPYWWEPLTITIEGFWSIFYSLPFTNLGAATAWLPAHFPSWSVLHYHIFYLSAFASVKNGAIHCCCSSCLAKMAQQIVKRMNRPADSETNSSLGWKHPPSLCFFCFFYFYLNSFRTILGSEEDFESTEPWSVDCCYWWFRFLFIFLAGLNLGGTVMLWLAPSPHSKTVLGLNQPAEAFLWNLHLLPVPAWLPSGYSGCVSQSTALHTRLNP